MSEGILGQSKSTDNKKGAKFWSVEAKFLTHQMRNRLTKIVLIIHDSKDIQERIISNGFYIIRTKRNLLDINQAHEFYDEHRHKFFFNRLVTFMCSGECFFHILAREKAIETWRAMMGPTKVFKTLFTHPDTIRGTHGLTDTRNCTHGSDSPESAAREMKVLFPEFSISDWYTNEHDKFVNGDCEFNLEEFVHVPRKS